MKKSVFGLANNEHKASKIVDHLLSSGFLNADISVLYPDNNNTIRTHEDHHGHDKKGSLSTEKHTKAPEGATTGATAGGVLGGSLGLLAGIGALAIPGVGPFIAAGPLMAALSGSAVGGGLGLLIGALVGSGIPEYEAKKYESSLKEGNILISVHAHNAEQLKQATDIMKKEGAKDISTNTESSGSPS